MDFFNYGPISLLPLISKIFEKVVDDEMINYLTQYDILHKHQSSFRTKHWTDSCISYLKDTILKGFDNGLMTGMILIDLQKAFDIIDNNILLEKLKAIGFCYLNVNCFHSYLTDRAFFVGIENNLLKHFENFTCCASKVNSCPFAFLFYVNDMKQAMSSDLLLYADDSCLVFQHKYVIKTETNLKNDFSNLCEWCFDDKLSIHKVSISDRTKLNPFCSGNIFSNTCASIRI